MNTSTIRSDRIRLAGVPRPPGRGAGALSRAHLTAGTERWLNEVWIAATTGNAEPITPGPGIALTCAGSLARRESGPLSDLDLELVLDDRCALDAEEVATLAQRLWYPLWDSGLALDHAVRTIDEARETARADLSNAAAALDLRCIAGDDRVAEHLRSVLAADWRTDARHRLPELVASVAERHSRHGAVDQCLDPDLKEAEGGLRDMVVLRALAASWLADYSHGRADAAHHLLLDTRDALQLATRRARNRLVVEEHDAVAAQLGIDPDTMLALVSQAGRTITRELRSTMRRALRARTPQVGPDRRQPRLTALGDGVHVHEGEVVLGRGADPSDPLLPLVLAGHAARADLPISPVTARNLAERVPSLPTPWAAPALDLLVALLRTGRPALAVWDTLEDAELVGRWIPAWAAIRSRPQRHPVHRWTVDRHSLECVAFAAEMTERVARPDILLLAALLHDIGKIPGAGTEHSTIGAEIAAGTLAGLGADPQTSDAVVRLVREHLTLAGLATRSDPTDPAAVERLCISVDRDAALLDQLAALTEADSRATGTGVWTAWRAEQVQAFVTAAHRVLD